MTNRGNFMSIRSPMSINLLKSRRHCSQKDIYLGSKKERKRYTRRRQTKTKMKSWKISDKVKGH